MLDIMQIPDPEAFMQSSRHFEESSIQYQGDMQTLSTGQSTLSESWEGDGATAYSQSHNQMQQVGEIHQQQRQQVAAMLSGTIAPLGEAKMLQDTAMSMMEESEMLTAQAAVEAADPFTAPAAAATEAAAAELAAQAQAMQASAQAIVQGVCANWQAVLGELMGSMQAGMDTGTLGGSNSSGGNSGSNNDSSGNGNSSGGNNDDGGNNNKPPTGGSENPGDKPRQGTNNLDKLYEEAGPADQQLKAFATQFAEKTGGTPVLPELKKRDRAQKKIADDYNGDASYLVDIARGTIKYDTMGQVDAARAQFESELHQFAPDAQIVRVKDRFANPTPSGYRDYLTNIRMSNGHIAELQIHLSPIEAVKAREHDLYEKVQDITRQAKNEGRLLTPEERICIDELNAQSQEIYREAIEGKSTH